MFVIKWAEKILTFVSYKRTKWSIIFLEYEDNISNGGI